jgi:hypothetical protein
MEHHLPLNGDAYAGCFGRCYGSVGRLTDRDALSAAGLREFSGALRTFSFLSIRLFLNP